MKNVLIAILLLTTLAGGYYWVTQQRLSLVDMEGRTEKVIRGNLVLPITANGEVRPARRVEIKAEASGEVINIPRKPGDRVRVGDLLIQLNRDDEERSVKRARQDLEIAEARVKTAEYALQKMKTADLLVAESQVAELAQIVEYAKFQLDKLESLGEANRNPEELLLRRTTYLRNREQWEQAKQRVEGIRLSIPQAEQEVRQARATRETAEYNLADAEKRLSKTEIVAPIDGIVGDIRTQIGEIIQSGKTTFTGGTVLAVLLDVDRYVVRADVDEADIGRVRAIAPEWARPGVDSSIRMPDDLRAAVATMPDPPEITIEACRGEKFVGVIERIYPEPKTLQGVTTYAVDVVVASDNRDKLLSGMRAEVRFTSERADNVVLVPNEAIREGPRGHLGVFIPKADTPSREKQYEFVECRFGLDNGNYSEVLAGLTEGQVVYTKLPAKKDDDKNRSRRRG